VREFVRGALDNGLEMFLQLMQLQFVTSSIHLCEPGTPDLSVLLLRDDDVAAKKRCFS